MPEKPSQSLFEQEWHLWWPSQKIWQWLNRLWSWTSFSFIPPGQGSGTLKYYFFLSKHFLLSFSVWGNTARACKSHFSLNLSMPAAYKPESRSFVAGLCKENTRLFAPGGASGSVLVGNDTCCFKGFTFKCSSGKIRRWWEAGEMSFMFSEFSWKNKWSFPLLKKKTVFDPFEVEQWKDSNLFKFSPALQLLPFCTHSNKKCDISFYCLLISHSSHQPDWLKL